MTEEGDNLASNSVTGDVSSMLKISYTIVRCQFPAEFLDMESSRC